MLYCPASVSSPPSSLPSQGRLACLIAGRDGIALHLHDCGHFSRCLCAGDVITMHPRPSPDLRCNSTLPRCRDSRVQICCQIGIRHVILQQIPSLFLEGFESSPGNGLSMQHLHLPGRSRTVDLVGHHLVVLKQTSCSRSQPDTKQAVSNSKAVWL